MRQDSKRLFGAVAVAVVVAGAGGFCLASWLGRDSETAPPPAQVEAEHADEHHADEEDIVALTAAQIRAAAISVVSPTRGAGSEIRLSGRVEPMIDAKAAVGAAVSGRIERVLVAPGQSVRAGQAVAVLISGDAAGLRADADAAAAAADAARRAHERDQSLGAQGVVARQEIEASAARALSAEASARAARARLQAAGAPNAAGRVTISAPISGVVTSVAVGPGGFITQGGLVAEITNPARVELVFNAPPAVSGNARAGDRMTVQGGSSEFGAVIVGVAAGLDGGATLVRARADGGGLPPAGSPVTGALVSDEDSQGFSVPSEAVQTVEGRSAVFVQTAQGFRATPVLTGRQAGGRTEIVRGLAGNERIAAANAFLLKAELAKGEAEHVH